MSKDWMSDVPMLSIHETVGGQSPDDLLHLLSAEIPKCATSGHFAIP